MKLRQLPLTSLFTLAVLLSTVAGAMSSNASAFSLLRSQAYLSAKDALDDGQWRRAAEMFDSIADERGSEADAALYWAAYALHNQVPKDERPSKRSSLRNARASFGSRRATPGAGPYSSRPGHCTCANPGPGTGSSTPPPG